MSHEAFQKLVSACFVSNDIYSFVSAFGSRVKDSDTNFGGYFRRLHHSLDNGYHPNATFCEKAQIDMASGETLRSVLQVEFCFSVRYPEKHGRDLENPWVMRRILVYQQHNLDAQNSTWIFLQCPSNLRKRLVSTLSVPERTKFSFIEHTKLHMVIFGEIFKGWRAYVNHLETVVEDLVSHSIEGCLTERQEQEIDNRIGRDSVFLSRRAGTSLRLQCKVCGRSAASTIHTHYLESKGGY